jgi:hypothetical protein
MSDNQSTQDYGKNKTIVNKPLDWSNTLFLSEQAKSLRFMKDADGNIFAVAAVLFDPTNIGSNILAMGKVSIADPNLPNSNARVFASPHQPILSTSFTSILAMAAQMVYNPTTLSMEVLRTPTTFTTIGASANGDSLLLAAAATQSWRVFKVILTVSKDAACAGALTIRVSNGAGAADPFVRLEMSTAALVATGNVIVAPFDLGPNGKVCTVNTNIYLNLSGALTAGQVGANIYACLE